MINFLYFFNYGEKIKYGVVKALNRYEAMELVYKKNKTVNFIVIDEKKVYEIKKFLNKKFK